MTTRPFLLTCMLAVIVAGCSYSEKQWMKVNENYTTAEFRRDHSACSKGGTLDEGCMRARGWVDVKPSAADRAADTPAAPTAAPQDYRWRR